MKKIAIYIASFLLISVTLKLEAQNIGKQDTQQTFKHGVGAGAGFTTGFGLSYRYMPLRYGVQLNFAPYHSIETDMYSLGLTFLYRLVETQTANLYLYQGNHYFYNSQTIYYVDQGKMNQTIDQTNYSNRTVESYVNNGLGIGIEFIIVKRIGFNIMMGYATYNNFSEVNFTGETGLYFKF